VQHISKYKTLVDASIDAFIASNKQQALYEPINYILQLGGKRMRPILTLMAADMYGVNLEKAVNAGIALEVFHNFTLLHDDIMDQAPLRRGKPTAHEKWGVNSAILSGDAMFVQSVQLLAKDHPKQLPAMLDLFNKTALEVCEGQQLDMDFEERENVALDEYIEMITLKTSVLLGAALEMGALVADAPKEDAKHLYEFGKNIGIAFQIQDDILDAYGDADKFGKRVGGDIVANKKTYLMITALDKANPAERQDLEEALAVCNEDLKVERVTSMFNHLSVRHDAEKAMDYFFNLALSELDKISSVSEEKKQPLKFLAEYLIEREE
jgi:geranylgeranyl diphosphate synthase type II